MIEASIRMRKILSIIIFGLLVSVGLPAKAQKGQPNVVIIFMDDMLW
jgi:hypothetical protein